MELDKQTKKPFFSGVFMQIVFKYKKHLAIIGIAVIILSVIFSSPFFITPLYKSTVILYPTASKSISKALLSESSGNQKDILEFGEEEQTEQMLQILNSNKIMDRVIRKYNLMEHYGISPKARYKMTQLYKEYENNFKFRRTEYMAVKISVFDKDPQMAADMANDVAELVDSTINQMQKEVAKKAFEIVKNEYFKLKNEVKVKEDSMTVLRELGVHDYESQAEMFNRQLAIEMARGNTEGVRRLQKKLKILAKYGGPYVSLRDALEYDKKQLSQVKARYEEAKVDATENLPHKFIVSSAYKAEKKSYPIRWLIVMISTVSSLFLSILIFGAMEVFSGRIDLDELKKKSKSLTGIKRLPVFANDKVRRPVAEKKEISENQPQEKIKDTEIKKVEQKNDNLQNESPAKENGDNISEKNEIKNTSTESKRNNKNIEMDNFFNSSNLLKLITKWKYHLLIIVGISALLAVIFSGPKFITPKYKSYAIVYPANIEPYSEESETEQMLQIINSQDIIDSVIKKFDLAKHYEINPSYKYFRTVLLYRYRQNVKISKTPYESVLIEVYDKSPDTAMLMVNAIIKFYDKKISNLHKTKYREVVDMYKKQLAQKRAHIDSLKQIMYTLGTEYGIFEYDYQSQEIMRGYLRTLTGQGAERVNTKEVNRLLNNMERKSGLLIEVVQMIQDESRTYVETKLDLELAQRFLNATMTYSNIVTHPFVADKKSYPIRWLIVLIVTLAAFVFAMLVILVIEKRKFSK
ncbi:MAG: hypothetical protein GXO86_05870 [Chlorobi bacterium]|nr:hypothetical protein [Chlorobiota bacterium]